MTLEELPDLYERLHFLCQIMRLRPDQLESIVQRLPEVMQIATVKQLVPLAVLLKEYYITPKQLSWIAVRCPDFLLVPVRNDLKLKMEYLISVGMAKKTVTRLILKRPVHFIGHFEFGFRRKCDYLLDAGLSVEALLSLMRYSDDLLRHPVEQNIIPKIRFFDEMGYSVERTSQIIERYPFLYFMSLDRIIRPFFEQKFGKE